MYPDVEADGTEWAQHFSSQQKAAEARLQQLEQQKASKKFWDDYRRREQRFQQCQSSMASSKPKFFTRSLQAWRRTGFDVSPHMRRAVFGSTDGFNVGLSQSHGKPVPESTLRRAFREIDSDKDGLVSVKQLLRALRNCGVDASRANVERILQECGYHRGQINEEQFIRFFRATERLSWSVDDDYNPAGGCCTYACRFGLFLLLVADLVLFIVLLRSEPNTMLWVGLFIAWIALTISFVLMLIPVICFPLRRAWKLGQRRRTREADVARQAGPALQRAKTEVPRKRTTWFDAVDPDPDVRGSLSEPQTTVEAYTPELYRAAQQSAARAPRQGGLRACAGALSSEALDFEGRAAQLHPQPAIWQAQPGRLSQERQPAPTLWRPQPAFGDTAEVLQAELRPSKNGAEIPRGARAAAKQKAQQQEWQVLDCD